MKKLSFLLMAAFSLTGLSHAMQPPTDYVDRYEFVNQDFSSRTRPDGNLAVQNSSTSFGGVVDRFNRADNAIQVGLAELEGQELSGANAMSLTFWLKGPNNARSNGEIVVSARDLSGGVADRIQWRKRPNNLYALTLRSENNIVSSRSEFLSINDNQWHHVAIIVDVTPLNNDDVRVYIDGEEVPGYARNLNQNRTDLFDTGTRVIVGRNGDFNDSIDDLQVFERALTAQEVVAIFNRQPNVGTIFVDIDATGSNDGTSWGDAFTDLRSAFDASENSSNIWIADGTYRLNSSSSNTRFFYSI